VITGRPNDESKESTMRFLTMVKGTKDVGPPPPELVEAMGKCLEGQKGSGKMVDSGGLLAGAAATRIRLSDGKIIVSDGPFAESTELVGGYSILEVSSREEAVAMATEVVQIHLDYWPGWVGEFELRQIADFRGGPPS
jgi:hypothetical protein